jgi:hypothetical protein
MLNFEFLKIVTHVNTHTLSRTICINKSKLVYISTPSLLTPPPPIRYQILQSTKGYNETVRVYEAKLEGLGVPQTEETKFEPIVDRAGIVSQMPGPQLITQ